MQCGRCLTLSARWFRLSLQRIEDGRDQSSHRIANAECRCRRRRGRAVGDVQSHATPCRFIFLIIISSYLCCCLCMTGLTRWSWFLIFEWRRVYNDWVETASWWPRTANGIVLIELLFCFNLTLQSLKTAASGWSSPAHWQSFRVASLAHSIIHKDKAIT